MPKSTLYHCEVVHKRLYPKHHSFKYKIAMLLLDLDNLERTSAQHRFFSYNQWIYSLFLIAIMGPVMAPLFDSGQKI